MATSEHDPVTREWARDALLFHLGRSDRRFPPFSWFLGLRDAADGSFLVVADDIRTALRWKRANDDQWCGFRLQVIPQAGV
jgi:hypothetical protein